MVTALGLASVQSWFTQLHPEMVGLNREYLHELMCGGVDRAVLAHQLHLAEAVVGRSGGGVSFMWQSTYDSPVVE